MRQREMQTVEELVTALVHVHFIPHQIHKVGSLVSHLFPLILDALGFAQL